MTIKVNGRNTNDVSLDSIGAPSYKTLADYLRANGSAGIFEGGTITDSGGGQIDIAAAKGVIRTSDSETGEMVAFNIAATTDVSLTDNSMNYVYINYNAGSPVYAVTTDYDSINFHTEIIVGRVYRSGTIINIANIGQYIADHILRDLYRLQYIRKLEWGSGAILGFTAATRRPTVSAGVYFSNYSKVETAAFNASSTDRFTYWYRNGSGGWTQVTSQQNIDNLNYDAGTGTLTALGTGDYGVHWVYQLTDGTIHVQYGQATYTSLANARNSTVPSSQPIPVIGMGILIGRFIIAKNATTIYEASSAFSYTFTGTATTNHNDLANIDGGGTYHLSAPSAPSTARYRNVTAIDTGETVRSNKALFDDSTPPAMNGSAATGISMEVSRDDHVHPSDTSRIAKATNVTAINDTGIADGEIAIFNLSNKDIRTSDKTIVTTLGSDDTTVPTSKAVKDVTDARFSTTSDINLADGKSIKFIKALGTDTTISGATVTATAGESVTFGQLCYLKSDGKYWKADSDAASTMPVVVMATASISADASGVFIKFGYVRNDAWNWTVGAQLYASGTPGGITETAPTGSSAIVQIVGNALSADIIEFNPDRTYIELVA